MKHWKLGPKVYAIVLLLSAVAACVGAVAITGFQGYNDLVERIDRASSRAVIGERVNGLIYAVVMDSRGIYMSSTVQESEKYAPLVLQNLQKIDRLMAQWTALVDPEDKATMDRANAR